MTAALAAFASAAVASPGSAAHTVCVKSSRHGRKSIIPQLTDLEMPRLTDVNRAFLLYPVPGQVNHNLIKSLERRLR